MKNSKIYSKVFMVLFVGASIISNAQKGFETASINIEDYFPGANFMKVVLAESNGLNLSKDQLHIFTEWASEHQSKVAAKNTQIADLEKEIKSLSQEGVAVPEIVEKVEKTNALRLEVANTKLSCRALVQNTLKSKQWESLVANYEENHPFVERTKMMEVIQHVNPAPNYMSVINANISELNISTGQKKITDAWSAENHPKMMEMANKIISLEKEIYEESLKDTSKDVIYEKFEEINKIRTQIVDKKTNCRNLVKGTLDEAQWKQLVAKTM
jgi:hypothetical protein